MMWSVPTHEVRVQKLVRAKNSRPWVAHNGEDKVLVPIVFINLLHKHGLQLLRTAISPT